MSDHSGAPPGHHGGSPGHHGHGHGYAAPPGYTDAPVYPVPSWRGARDSRDRAASPYADWGSRVGAYLLDAFAGGGAVVLALFAGGIAGSLTRNTALGGTAATVLAVAALTWLFRNRYVRAGRTGQSLGKSALGIRLLDERTGRPVGVGRALVRDIAHVVDSAVCCAGYLMPLWDGKRQTIADKITRSVVVRDG